MQAWWRKDVFYFVQNCVPSAWSITDFWKYSLNKWICQLEKKKKRERERVWENTLENVRIPVNVNLCNDNFTFNNTHWEPRETAMAPHSSALAWTIPWMEEPGRLQSMGSLRVGHDSASSLLLFTFMHWRRKWQPTPVSLPGESQGWGNLLGCHLWGSTELDTTEAT